MWRAFFVWHRRGLLPVQMVDFKRKPLVDLGSLARSHADNAVATIAGLMRDGLEESTRLRAADILLDRGFGRPKQETTTELRGEVRVLLRKMLTDDEMNADNEEPRE